MSEARGCPFFVAPSSNDTGHGGAIFCVLYVMLAGVSIDGAGVESEAVSLHVRRTHLITRAPADYSSNRQRYAGDSYRFFAMSYDWWTVKVDSADSGWYSETMLNEALVKGTIGYAAAMLQLGRRFREYPGCASNYKFAM